MKVEYKNESNVTVNARGLKLLPGESLPSKVIIKPFGPFVKSGLISMYIDGVKQNLNDETAHQFDPQSLPRDPITGMPHGMEPENRKQTENTEPEKTETDKAESAETEPEKIETETATLVQEEIPVENAGQTADSGVVVTEVSEAEMPDGVEVKEGAVIETDGTVTVVETAEQSVKETETPVVEADGTFKEEK